MNTETGYTLPPSIYNAYHICRRQAWLMHRQLTADQHNSYLEIGRIIDEDSFSREKKKIYLADVSAMIDMVTKKDGRYFIAEIKKSSRRLDNAVMQLKYYLYLLKQKSIEAGGILKIPKEKKNIDVVLTEEDIREIGGNIKIIKGVLYNEIPPERINRKVCVKCAHFEFCWS